MDVGRPISVLVSRRDDAPAAAGSAREAGARAGIGAVPGDAIFSTSRPPAGLRCRYSAVSDVLHQLRDQGQHHRGRSNTTRTSLKSGGLDCRPRPGRRQRRRAKFSSPGERGRCEASRPPPASLNLCSNNLHAAFRFAGKRHHSPHPTSLYPVLSICDLRAASAL